VARYGGAGAGLLREIERVDQVATAWRPSNTENRLTSPIGFLAGLPGEGVGIPSANSIELLGSYSKTP